jgi:outer membrane receptor protein involved in Fe transport
MTWVPGFRGLPGVALLVAALVPAAFGQTATGTISGRVTDSGGAVIVGATIDLTSIERGAASSLSTNEAGIYVFPSVPPGHYRLTARSQGFKQDEAQDVLVEVGSRLQQNFQLEIGSVRESVMVETAEPLVNTVSSTVSSVVSGAPIQDLPLNGRDTLQLALTQPGVTPQLIGTPGVPSIPGFAGNGFSIAGGRSNSVTYMLDGGVNNSVANSTAVVDPNPDTIAEFRILTNNYSAEYGRSNGGIVNVVTKSGTNGIHGTLYDYLRNKDLNANNFFNQATPGGYSPVPTLIRNQFGVTAGGPLTIPKVVSGKDRFFWFFGYQGQRQNSVTVNPQVGTFTPAELTGDFSHAVKGGPDPGVAAFLGAHPYFQPNPALASQAIIDPSRIDPVAQAFIKSAPIPTSPTGILTPNGTAQDNRDEFLGKTDFQINPGERLSVTLVRNHNPVLNPFPGSSAPGYSVFNLTDTYFGEIALSSVITPALLNEVHFTSQRIVTGNSGYTNPSPGAPSLGFQITPDLSTAPPVISFGVTGLTLGYSGGSVPGKYADTSYFWTDNVSWTKGVHTFKFGGSFAIVQNNGQFAYETNGTLAFNGPTAAGGIGSGNDLADFLFGLPNSFTQWPNAFSSAHGHQYGIFAQDEWRIRPNLTLTLGLRYEYNTPKFDPQERNYMIIPGQQSTKFPLAPLGLNFPCDPHAPCPGVYFPDKNNFAPRFGFAYDPSGKGRTSIRGGFGVFYDVLNAQDIQWQNGTVPFYSSAVLTYTKANVPANGPSTIMSDPYGTAGVVNPFPSQPLSPSLNFQKAGFLPFGPNSVLIDPNQRNPYTYGWNLTAQQAVGAGMAVQVAYVGSSSHKQIVNVEDDPFIQGTTLRPLNLQPGLQYPNAFAYMSVDKSLGSSNYNGLLTSITKRIGNSVVGETFFTAAYTYAKVLSDQDSYLQNISAYNQHQFYAPAVYDTRQRFVLSGGWQLPFDRMWARGPKRLTGGWSLYPIFSTQTGFPVDFNSGLARSVSVPGPGGDGVPSIVRPYWTGGAEQMLDPRNVETFTINGVQRTGHFFFNPSGFLIPACYASTAPPGTPGGCPAPTYGSLQRNTFRGPGLTNFDLSLEKKTILVGDRIQLLFRAEYFNVLNHTEFLSPFGQVSARSALVGQVTSTKDPRIGQLALKLVF